MPASAERARPELSRELDGGSASRRHPSQLAIDGMKGVIMHNQQRIEDLRAIAARGCLCQIGAHTSRVHAKRRQHIANKHVRRLQGLEDIRSDVEAAEARNRARWRRWRRIWVVTVSRCICGSCGSGFIRDRYGTASVPL